MLGADIVEVSPYDGPGEQTSYLANRVVLEILNGMAERKTETELILGPSRPAIRPISSMLIG